MNTLSLFDGMSGGQIALKDLGISVNKYYASEIDKFAIAQTKLNFPDTIFLGDVVRLRNAMCWSEKTFGKAMQSEYIRKESKKSFAELRSIDWSTINLLLAGSPCQGFSFAGKQLAFKDPRSKLFFVFVDILNHIKKLNPDVKFLLENVNMAKRHLEVITRYVGVFPVRINSNLVSAQNRDRWYWTNIRTKQVGLFGELHADIPQPEDRGILLRDILESEVSEKYFISKAAIKRMLGKNYSIPKINPDKTGCLNQKNNSGQLAMDSGTTLVISDRGQGSSYVTSVEAVPPLSSRNGCSHDHYIYQLGRGFNKGGLHEDKSPTLSSNSWEQNNLVASKSNIRRLTPTECARLQTIPEWYKWECSETQQYRMLGNGWTNEVIKYILKYLI